MRPIGCVRRIAATATAAVIILLAEAGLSAAAGVLHLHDRTVDASLSGVDSSGRLLFEVGGDVGGGDRSAPDEPIPLEPIPLEQIAAWQGEVELRQRAREAIVLTDGSLIYGTLLTIRGERILLQHAAFGPQEFGFDDVAGIVFDGDAVDVAGLLSAWSADSLQTEDTVYTAAGDSVAGVADIDQRGLSLLSRRAEASVTVRRGAETLAFSVSKLAAIRFSPALRPIASLGDGGWWLGFDEGTQLRVVQLAVSGDSQVACQLACGTMIAMPEPAMADQLVAIEHPSQSPRWQLLGPAELLDAKAIAPFAFRQQPSFAASWSVPWGGETLPANRCRMRGASRLVWDVGGSWTHLTGTARLEPPPDPSPLASDVRGAAGGAAAATAAVRLRVFAITDAGAAELWSGQPLDTPGQRLNFTVPLAASGGRIPGRIVLLIDSDRRDSPQPSLCFEYLRLSRL